MRTAQASTNRVQWNDLSDDLQLALAEQALSRAAATIAGHAECLATEIDGGGLADQGGADALRLLAAVIRATNASQSDTKRH